VASERLHRRRRTVALAALAVVAVVAIALLVSRLSGSQGARQITGAPRDVVATVMQFEAALANRDWATICNSLYTKEARAAAGGARCAATLAQSAGGLREPRVTIVSLTVKGQAATVTVAASVNGKRPVTDSIQLAREGGRFRIASAGGD
jgi:hypothetical protein